MFELPKKKRILEYIVIVLPLMIGFLYSIGYSFYNGYLNYFNIPRGLFDIGINETIFEGVRVISRTVTYWIYGSLYFFLWAFVFFILARIFEGINFSAVSKINNKIIRIFDFTPKSKSTKSIIECYQVVGMLMFLMASLMIMYITFIHASENFGARRAEEDKKRLSSNFKALNTGQVLRDTNFFMFEEKGGKKRHQIGYVVLSNANLFAVYTSENELIILPISELSKIRSYHGQFPVGSHGLLT